MCWMEKEKYYLLNVTSFWIYKIRLLVWRISDKSFFFELLGYLRWNMCYKEKVHTTKNRNRSGKIACNKVLSSPMYSILNQHRQNKILWAGCNRKIEWNCCEIITSYIEFMWLCIITSRYASFILSYIFLFPDQLCPHYHKTLYEYRYRYLSTTYSYIWEFQDVIIEVLPFQWYACDCIKSIQKAHNNYF